MFPTRTGDLLTADCGTDRIQEQQKYLDTTTDKVRTHCPCAVNGMLKFTVIRETKG